MCWPRYASSPMKSTSGGLVYSTDSGRICPVCRRPVADCACSARPIPQNNGGVRISLQTKGRGGKSVTLVKGLPLDFAALGALGKQLRSACGTGGTVKQGVVEVQGDHVAAVMAMLQGLGYDVKRSGG